MNIFIKPNFDKPDACANAVNAAEKLGEIAKRRGEAVGIFFEAGDEKYIGGKLCRAEFLSEEDALSRCDVIMPIGGDGTIMRAAQSAARANKPILGLNGGNIGFLTQLEVSELDSLEKLFKGDYKLFDRMMLEATIENDGETFVYTALNDVVIRHGDADRIVSIEVTDGGRLVAAYRADGVIFSSPTGSTAYSMSAGGPIVSPGLELIIMTAICPHSAFNCSLVLPPDEKYTVREKALGAESGMYVSVDGVRVLRLSKGGAVTVGRASARAKFIDLGLREFFSNLNEKLSWRR